MQLVLTEDQELLAKTARDFVAEQSPISRVRELRDKADATGFSRALWKQMAELGWVGIPFPERFGGAEMGLAELAVVLEELGRTLAPEPFLSSVLLAGEAIRFGSVEPQQSEWLTKLAAGETVLTLAHQEPKSRYRIEHVETRAEREGDGFRIHGQKIQVLDGAAADALVVPARTAGQPDDEHGITLFLVRRDAEGLSIEPQSRIDSRGAALVELDGVPADMADVVGQLHEGIAILRPVVDRATVGLCAEMLGSMSEAFERTLTYLQQRQQFGVPIGSFQALKHRAADLFSEIELCRSAVMAAARAVDEAAADAPQLVSLAKAICSDAAIHVANEAIQMFGGIGMTDEHDIGFYLKRARVAELTFGDATWHRARWAALSGY